MLTKGLTHNDFRVKRECLFLVSNMCAIQPTVEYILNVNNLVDYLL